MAASQREGVRLVSPAADALRTIAAMVWPGRVPRYLHDLGTRIDRGHVSVYGAYHDACSHLCDGLNPDERAALELAIEVLR